MQHTTSHTAAIQPPSPNQPRKMAINPVCVYLSVDCMLYLSNELLCYFDTFLSVCFSLLFVFSLIVLVLVLFVTYFCFLITFGR